MGLSYKPKNILLDKDGYLISLNIIGIAVLFQRFIDKGLLFKGRKALIMPVLENIIETWEDFLCCSNLFKVYSCENRDSGSWAYETAWKTTTDCSFHQTIVSNDLEATARLLIQSFQDAKGAGYQGWYLPRDKKDKKFKCSATEKVVGMEQVELVNSFLPSKQCETFEYNYYFAPLKKYETSDNHIVVQPLTESNRIEFVDLVKKNEGEVFLKNEELDKSDIFLEELNKQYQQIGFERRRFIYLAYARNGMDLVGAILCYTGPLGINLRFLESKSQLILSNQLSEDLVLECCCKLLSSVVSHYENFIPNFIPVLTREK